MNEYIQENQGVDKEELFTAIDLGHELPGVLKNKIEAIEEELATLTLLCNHHNDAAYEKPETFTKVEY